MKKTIAILVLIIFLGCSKTDPQNETLILCKNSISFGDIDICLPEIDGMTECYDIPLVKSRADKSEYEKSSVLAFYLNNVTYKQVARLDRITFDDYFKIYALNESKSVKISQEELDQMSDLLEGNFLKENWNEIEYNIKRKHDYLSVGKPILIESYSPHKKVKTVIMLTKVLVNDNEYVMVGSINLLLIKERLIWLAYYKNYEGEASIKKIKAKNDYIVLRLMDENK